jgi:hypothetical protein
VTLRERELVAALGALLHAGRAALRAQDRANHWASFGTNSPRARKAEARHEQALAALDAAEIEAARVIEATKAEARPRGGEPMLDPINHAARYSG